MTPVGIALVGCGVAAHDLCRAIDAVPEARLAAAYDIVRDAAASLATPRGAAIHDTLDGVLNDAGVELVYVGVPHDVLASTAERAIEAGHHVLVEKPVAFDVADIQHLAVLAGARARVVGVMFELREVGAVRVARRLLGEGAIGRVTAVRIRTVIDKPHAYWGTSVAGAASWRSRRDRSGGGVVLMNSIHQLDLVRYLTDQTFIRASAEVGTLAAPAGVEVEDVAAAALRLSGGPIVSLSAAAHSPGANLEERIEIDGSDGRLDLSDPYGNGTPRVYVQRTWGDLPARRWTDLAAPRSDPHASLLAGVVRAIRHGERPPVGLDDAEAALATVLAIYQSAAQGRAAPVMSGPATRTKDEARLSVPSIETL